METASSPNLLQDESINQILNCDYSVETLLGRLKQSITSCDEFAKFIRKKSLLQEEHYNGLRKISRQTVETFKSDQKLLRNDSFSKNLTRIVEFDDSIYNAGMSYFKALTLMYEQLTSLSNTISKNRKHLKEESKRKEKECIEAIAQAEKAKAKYDHFCSELERIRTTDPTKKTFTLKGSKTGSQQEEELSRKIEQADTDYRSKVTAAKKLKEQLLKIHRPAHSKAVTNLILETDLATSIQLQKYATFCETLLMNSGMIISPLKTEASKPAMKDIAASIDNEKDLANFIQGIRRANNKALVLVDYKIHPSIDNTPKTVTKSIFKNTAPPPTAKAITPPPPPPQQGSGGTSIPSIGKHTTLDPGSSSPSNPTFGVPIDSLVEREGDLVPQVVRQCIHVIEQHGLNREGIYRTSANVARVKELKERIDMDPKNIELIGPGDSSEGDLYVVASLLKVFFSSLPEPLLTKSLYGRFIEAVKIPDQSLRAKRLHQVVYELPDGPYWTLRSLIFHLNKVASKQDLNRMSERNLGIVWGPTLLYSDHTNPEDMSYQGKVVEELMYISTQIFEEE